MTTDSRTTEIGRRIRERRREQGMTQVELAEAVGTGQNRISDLERGATTEPKAETIVLLARALDVTTDYLLGVER